MSECDAKTGTCPTETAACSEAECCPACKTDCGGDLVTCALRLWGQSFFRAMQEVQTDILKEKIRKAWGPMMDKAADITLEGMDAKWRAMMAQAQTKETARSKLWELWQSKK
jgi:hypothetical protein